MSSIVIISDQNLVWNALVLAGVIVAIFLTMVFEYWGRIIEGLQPSQAQAPPSTTNPADILIVSLILCQYQIFSQNLQNIF